MAKKDRTDYQRISRIFESVIRRLQLEVCKPPVNAPRPCPVDPAVPVDATDKTSRKLFINGVDRLLTWEFRLRNDESDKPALLRWIRMVQDEIRWNWLLLADNHRELIIRLAAELGLGLGLEVEETRRRRNG
jgi:hypothetical protein